MNYRQWPLTIKRVLKQQRYLYGGVILLAITLAAVLVASPAKHPKTSLHKKPSVKTTQSVTKESAKADNFSTTQTQSVAPNGSNPSKQPDSTQTKKTSAPSPVAPAPTPSSVVTALPFGVSGGSLSNAYACLSSDGMTILYIQDAFVTFSANSGGQISFWLAQTGVSSLAGYAYPQTLTVPSGTWSTSLNKLRSVMGPGVLFSASIPSSGGQGAARVIVQGGGTTWYSSWINIPATVAC